MVAVVKGVIVVTVVVTMRGAGLHAVTARLEKALAGRRYGCLHGSTVNSLIPGAPILTQRVRRLAYWACGGRGRCSGTRDQRITKPTILTATVLAGNYLCRRTNSVYSAGLGRRSMVCIAM